jgi:hypothetical protein
VGESSNLWKLTTTTQKYLKLSSNYLRLEKEDSLIRFNDFVENFKTKIYK